MKKQLKYSILGLTSCTAIFLVGYFFITYGISLQIPDLPYSTLVLDKSGKEIGEIVYQNTIRHQPLQYEDIPEFYTRALISLEDRSFWLNNGISITGLLRSAWNNILAGRIVEGGSTLSSGLIRNTLWLNEKRSPGKKVLEFIYAIRLNHLYSKEKILTEYINRVSYGYLNYGLASASRYYFSKDPKNLTKAEQIALLILPKDPKKYNPYKENKAFKVRFSLIVHTLQKNNILTETEAKNILTEELGLNYNHKNTLPYVTDFIEHGYEKWQLPYKKTCGKLENSGVGGCDTVGAKMKSEDRWAGASTSEFITPSAPLVPFGDESTNKGIDPVSSTGGRILSIESPSEVLTTIDISLTQKIDTLARNTILDLAWKDVSDYGIIILDRETNELRTMIGGVNYHASEGQVNSTLALRQPGSTIKPFTYLLAFERLGLGPSDMILDLPTAYKTSEGYEYDPKNYSLDYKGQISIAEALSQSINIPAVKMADEVGVDNLLRFLRQTGMSSLTKDTDYYGLGLTLGNGEVSLYELTRAYSIFTREGKLCDIKVVMGYESRVTGNAQNPKPETQNCTSIASTQAISDINLILTNRYFKLGGFPIHSSLDFADRNVFVKTGTSRNFRDNWAVGYTDHYIIGVWTGNKNGAFMKGVSGATGAGEIFSRIVYTLEPKSIEQQPLKLEKTEKKYLEIISPLPGSIFTIDNSQSEKNQRIKLIFKSNYEFDAYSWLLDGKKIEGDFIPPSIGVHTIQCVLLKDGQILQEARNTFEIKPSGD